MTSTFESFQSIYRQLDGRDHGSRNIVVVGDSKMSTYLADVSPEPRYLGSRMSADRPVRSIALMTETEDTTYVDFVAEEVSGALVYVHKQHANNPVDLAEGFRSIRVDEPPIESSEIAVNSLLLMAEQLLATELIQ